MPDRRARSHHVLVAALTAAALVAAVPAAAGAGAGGSEVRRDAVYESTGNPRVVLVPLADAPDGGTFVRFAVELRCDDQDVAGGLLLRVDAEGAFERETTALSSDKDIGSESDATIEGRLAPDGGEGSIDVHIRSYDEEGTTAECEDTFEWRAEVVDAPVLTRVESFVRVGKSDQVAAAGDAIYTVTSSGNGRDTVRRLDPTDGTTVWSRRAGGTDGIAATTTSVWVASAFAEAVTGLSAEDGRRIRQLRVPEGFEAVSYGAPLAATEEAVWLALGPGRLVRLDPASGETVAEIELGDAPGADLAVGVGAAGVVVAIEEMGDEAGQLPLRVVRVDPATNEIVAETRLSGQVTDVAVTADVVTLGQYFDPVQRLDATTLEPLASLDFVGSEVVATGPYTWIVSDGGLDGLLVVDTNGETVLALPGVRGALAGTGDRVVLLDRAGYVLTLFGLPGS